MKYASKSIVGKRLHNEDSYSVQDSGTPPVLLAVADGMGGHAAGDVASRMVIDGLNEAISKELRQRPEECLRKAIREINLDVFSASQRNEACRGMGSTLVCALVDGGRYVAANVGDSRLYHFDGETLRRVTTDHSFVESLVQDGVITEEEALVHPMRNVITRAMGSGRTVEADLFECTWKERDILMLCTDGLHGSVAAEAMRRILSSDLSLAAMCDLLVDAATENGSTDNITVVLAQFDGAEAKL